MWHTGQESIVERPFHPIRLIRIAPHYGDVLRHRIGHIRAHRLFLEKGDRRNKMREITGLVAYERWLHFPRSPIHELRREN